MCFASLQGTVKDCPTPADPLPLFLAQVYAQIHATMRLNDAKGFVNGTTRGFKWFTVLGGMQVSVGTNLQLCIEPERWRSSWAERGKGCCVLAQFVLQILSSLFSPRL